VTYFRSRAADWSSGLSRYRWASLCRSAGTRFHSGNCTRCRRREY